MFDVIEALSPVAAKWKAIGTALRIKRTKLDEVGDYTQGKCSGLSVPTQ